MGGGEEPCPFNLTCCPPLLCQLSVNVDIGFGAPEPLSLYACGTSVGNPLTLILLTQCKYRHGEPGNELSLLIISDVRYEKGAGVIVLPTYLRLERTQNVRDMNPTAASAAFELGC